MTGDGVDLTKFPKLADHFARMLEIPAVKIIAPLHGIST
jgi:hypothetical protein